MVVRLQTTEGKNKKYRTAYGVGLRLENRSPDSEHSCSNLVPKKYVTNCRLEWKDMPSLQDECDHLDCAIKVAVNDMKSAPFYFMAFSMLLVWIIYGNRNRIGGHPFFDFFVIAFFAIIAFAILISGLRSWRNSIELAEYRDKGTIDGIRALQIFEDQEVAKAKHWWQFRR